MNTGMNVVVEQHAEQHIDHNCSTAGFLAVCFRPWTDSLLLDAAAMTEPEHSAVRFSIHTWITAVSNRASHKRASSTFGNGECRYPTRPLPPKATQCKKNMIRRSRPVKRGSYIKIWNW
jgi:hypothetical protein